jgi:hypothetical protein
MERVTASRSNLFVVFGKGAFIVHPRPRRTWLEAGALQIGAALLIGVALVGNAYVTAIGNAELTALRALFGADQSGPVSRVSPTVVLHLGDQP